MEKIGLPLDIWVRMYEEQIRHVRHHESLRYSSTNIALVLSAAVLGLFAANMTSDQQWVLSLSLIIVNVYALVLSLKHYERSRLHHAVTPTQVPSPLRCTKSRPVPNVKQHQLRPEPNCRILVDTRRRASYIHFTGSAERLG